MSSIRGSWRVFSERVRHPIQAWQVLVQVSASRFESYLSSHLTNFVGREQEISLLLGRWREAVGGEGQVVLLCGEAGIGKSRIARSLVTVSPMNGTRQFNSNVHRTISMRALSGDQFSAAGSGTGQSGQ